MKTKELIDKYEVRQSTDPEYNPPSYIWIDNTGELIRCRDCMHYDADNFQCETDKPHSGTWMPESYCDRAEWREAK